MFPCTGCGLCCQNIATVKELKEFDLGNGVCKFFDIKCLNLLKICQIVIFLENNGHSKCLLFSGTYIVSVIMFLE